MNGRRRKTVIWISLFVIYLGMLVITYGTAMAMRSPGWSTPAPNVHHVSPTPWPSGTRR